MRHAYISRKSCGCIDFVAIDCYASVAEDVAKVIKAGRPVEYVAFTEPFTLPQFCDICREVKP